MIRQHTGYIELHDGAKHIVRRRPRAGCGVQRVRDRDLGEAGVTPYSVTDLKRSGDVPNMPALVVQGVRRGVETGVQIDADLETSDHRVGYGHSVSVAQVRTSDAPALGSIPLCEYRTEKRDA